jgi:hypothetical protein
MLRLIYIKTLYTFLKKMSNFTQINFKLPEAERKILDEYVEYSGRKKTELLREFIRSLEKKIPKGGSF